MLKFLNTKTQKMSAAIITGAMVGAFADVKQAAATGIGGYTQQISNNVADPFADTIAFICYMGGFVLGALGLVNLKQHVEQGSQVPMKNGLAKLGFGGMLLALPPLVGAIQDSGTSTVAEAQFQGFTATGIQ